jgi:hypothetical protein
MPLSIYIYQEPMPVEPPQAEPAVPPIAETTVADKPAVPPDGEWHKFGEAKSEPVAVAVVKPKRVVRAKHSKKKPVQQARATKSPEADDAPAHVTEVKTLAVPQLSAVPPSPISIRPSPMSELETALPRLLWAH